MSVFFEGGERLIDCVVLLSNVLLPTLYWSDLCKRFWSKVGNYVFSQFFVGSLPLLQLILLASKPSFNNQSKSIACDRDCCDESAWVDPPDIICDNWDKNWGTIGFCWQANLNSTTNLKALHVIIEVKMCDNWVDPPRGHWPLLAVSWRRFRNLAKL